MDDLDDLVQQLFGTIITFGVSILLDKSHENSNVIGQHLEISRKSPTVATCKFDKSIIMSNCQKSSDVAKVKPLIYF